MRTTGTVEITIDKKYAVQSFGETKLMVDYFLKTVANDGYTENTYRVSCVIGGLETTSPVLYAKSAKLVGSPENTNQDTLVESAVIDIFNDNLD